jgi:hypothetical protein
MIAADLIRQAAAVPIEDEIARRGVRLSGRIDRAGPCPVCGGVDRFSINVRKQCWNCRGCGVGGDVIAMVQHLDGCTFAAAVATLTGSSARPQAAAPAPAKSETADDYERCQRRKAAWLWSQRQSPIGTMAERYLREARGYVGPIPPTIGFLPPHNGHGPAMIAAYAMPVEIEDGEPDQLGEPTSVAAVHLTRLLPDGSDREPGNDAKITIARPMGLAIVLSSIADGLSLFVTEGIEDALSHAAAGYAAWAAGSSPLMPAMAASIPDYVTCVLIEQHPGAEQHTTRLAELLRARPVRPGERPIEVILVDAT